MRNTPRPCLELRERIARALESEAVRCELAGEGGERDCWLWEADAAIAAIEASGPTPDMVEAGWKYLGMVDLHRDELAEAFRVMIRAARPRGVSSTDREEDRGGVDKTNRATDGYR